MNFSNPDISIIKDKKLYIFDMDGTIYLGGNPFDFAIRFIKNLRANGKRVLFYTNNASHTTPFYMSKLSRLGFEPQENEIMTSGDVTYEFLKRHREGKSVYLVATDELVEEYRNKARQLHATAKKSRKYGYVFDSAAKLCDIMAIKYELGLRTRRAYERKDMTELERLAKNEYVKVEKLIDIYARAFEKQWFTDNKPHGFDIQDQRLGALLRRTDACRRRILAYTTGKIDRIDELEEKLLPYKYKERSINYNNAQLCSTANSLL